MASVLIVDDDPLLVRLLEHRLVASDFKVTSATDGEAALELLQYLQPSAIVLDAKMPGMDGFEVLRRLKADVLRRRIPVVMLTAVRREQDVLQALQRGASEYMVKPFDPDDLIARLRRLITAARAA